MNKHIFFDNITASIGGLIAGKKKFFAKNVQSPSFEEHVAAIELESPTISGEGIYEIKARTLVGELDSAIRVAKWIGNDFPTIIYHHGNNERPFDFKESAKNTFYKILAKPKDSIEANLIVVRAPFHNDSLRYYQEKMTELKNFVAMISTSVKLNEILIQNLQGESKAAIITTGISLGGWVTNLHRGIYNSSTAYAPIMAGTFLGELFLKSKYRKMASDLALCNPDQIKRMLNFDELFKTKNSQNIFPLLCKYDQFIEYNIQQESYKDYPLKTINYGHISGSLCTEILREHILEVLNYCSIRA
jgi:hypothetical protein